MPPPTKPAPQPKIIRIAYWIPVRRDTLRGFCDIEFPFGLTINSWPVHRENGIGRVELPITKGEDGVVRPIGKWMMPDMESRFAAKVIELIELEYPGTTQ